MKKNYKKTIKPISKEKMSQVKGGYRATRGTRVAAVTSRWDEVILRFGEGGTGSRGTQHRPQHNDLGTTSTHGNILA